MDTSNSSDPDRSAFARDGKARTHRLPWVGDGVRGWVRPARAAAFSLIEVTMAVGIMGFAFVAILGMVPLGLNNFHDIKNTVVSSQVAQKIISEVQVTPFALLTQAGSNPQTIQTSPGVYSTTLRLPAPNQTSSTQTRYVRYFSEQAIELAPGNPSGIYQVNTRVLVGPGFIQPATATATMMGVGNTSIVTVTVQVAYNPGRQVLDLNMDKNDPSMWSATGQNAHVQIYQVDTTVARNF